MLKGGFRVSFTRAIGVKRIISVIRKVVSLHFCVAKESHAHPYSYTLNIKVVVVNVVVGVA